MNENKETKILESSPDRLLSLDIAKGLCIIFVVWLHVVSGSAGGILGTMFSVVYLCFGSVLGLFFFLSGYTFKSGKSFGKNTWHRTKTLLIPTMIFAFIVCVIGFFSEWIFCARPSICEYAVNYLKNLIDVFAFKPFGEGKTFEYFIGRSSRFLLPLWFAYRLYFSDIIFFAVEKLALKNFRNFLITIIILLSVTVLCMFYCHFIYHLRLNAARLMQR